MPRMIQVIAALGNPGPEYAHTRHNAGWLALDAWAAGIGWKRERGMQALVGHTLVAGRKLWLIKPQTFMNLSGQAIGPLMQFYKFKPEELLVVHDEVAFDVGKARLTLGGSAGGHNGVQSVINSLGSEGFWRLRLGVGPRNPMFTLSDWVLGGLEKDEQAWLTNEAPRALQLALDGDPAKGQNEINR